MSARPRGFIQRWSPRAETRELLDQVNQVLGEYVNLLPLTARQIFYRLVGAYGYEKTEQASERLGKTLNKAPRACLVDMDAIRDDGFTSAPPVFVDDVDDFFATVADWAEGLRSLIGLCSVELASGMVANDLRVMTGKNGPWAATPAQKQFDPNGNPRLDPNGTSPRSHRITRQHRGEIRCRRRK
jgi:DNA-binding cell septation regulator SpoVG